MPPPLYLPLVPVYWGQDVWWPGEQNLEVSEEVCTDVGSSVDTDAPRCEEDFQLSNVYDVPATWHIYEDGLWLRTRPPSSGKSRSTTTRARASR